MPRRVGSDTERPITRRAPAPTSPRLALSVIGTTGAGAPASADGIALGPLTSERALAGATGIAAGGGEKSRCIAGDAGGIMDGPIAEGPERGCALDSPTGPGAGPTG